MRIKATSSLLLFLLIGISNAFSQINLTNGLIVKYDFNGNALDESGQGNDATLHGAKLVPDRFGTPNSAYEVSGNTGMNGSDIYIEIPEVVDGLDNLTISLWVKQENYTWSTYGETYISFGTLPAMGTVATSIYYSKENNNLEFVLMTGDNTKYHCTTPFDSSWMGTWQHYVLVYDGSLRTLKGYRNGELVASKNDVTGNVYAIGDYAGINKHWWSSAEGQSTRMNGIFDDVRIYSRALNPDEVYALYNEGNCVETVYDTVVVTVYDTIAVYDTIQQVIPKYVSVTDTLFINVDNNYNLEPIVLKVYPNPAKEILYIDSGENYSNILNYRLLITNEIGQKIFDQPIDRKIYTLDLHTWVVKGVYFVSIINTENRVLATRKIVLQ